LVAEAGQQVEFDKVLMVQTDDGLKVGKPYLESGKVTATIKAHGRHPKVRIVKFRRRKHYMKQAGHRQNYTEIQITDISA
jgi:large subunit ribosomal protein L21